MHNFGLLYFYAINTFENYSSVIMIEAFYFLDHGLLPAIFFLQRNNQKHLWSASLYLFSSQSDTLKRNGRRAADTTINSLFTAVMLVADKERPFYCRAFPNKTQT